MIVPPLAPLGVSAGGTDLTFLLAVTAGVISFLSPCVLPLVPAYLGQLTAIAVDASTGGQPPSRWVALSHAAAYVVGFGVVFTVLGVTATYVGAGLGPYLDTLRKVGGVVLIAMGLNLAGFLTIPRLQRTWRPLDAGATTQLAGMSGTVALGRASGTSTGLGDRLGGRVVSGHGLLASFGLGLIFAIGWTPCIGIILGGILAVAATSGSTLQGGLLLVGYTLGLGLPFLAIGVLYDRAPAILAPLRSHARAVEIVGGLLVVAIGVAMLLDVLALAPRYFQFLSAI